MFLGGQKRQWNPQTIPYIAGARNHIYIIDILHSAIRLKKWLLFVSIASRKRSLLLFVLRPAFEVMLQMIEPIALSVIKWKGGILSNYRCVSSQFPFARKPNWNAVQWQRVNDYEKLTVPHIVISFAEYYDKGDVCLDEARKTRTPSCTLADTALAPYSATFQVFSNPNFEASSFVTHLTLAAIRKGKRIERCKLHKALQKAVTIEANSRFHIATTLRFFFSTPLIDTLSNSFIRQLFIKSKKKRLRKKIRRRKHLHLSSNGSII
jgi:ribosomal protein S2